MKNCDKILKTFVRCVSEQDHAGANRAIKDAVKFKIQTQIKRAIPANGNIFKTN